MARTNIKVKDADHRKDADGVRVAGGFGVVASWQGNTALLRRAVLSTMLWEDTAYQTGGEVAAEIIRLVPLVTPGDVADIAIEARTVQGLRHVPLLIVREMLKHPEHKKLVGALLPMIILRPDELTEFVSLYWQDGKRPLANQAKVGLREAFKRFNAYALAKWNRDGAVKLRDVLFLTHPNPDTPEQALLWKQLADNALPTPDTWEVALSAGKDKKATWERLITEGRLGQMAFIRNLRAMEQVGVDRAVIKHGFATISTRWVQPLTVMGAVKHAPSWERDLESLMLRALGDAPKLPGRTILIVDVSGSMGTRISSKSEMSRLDAAAAMAMLASEVCEDIAIYATAGSDGQRTHQTELLRPRRGFAMVEDIQKAQYRLGGGGIFTRQCLEFIRAQERQTPDRIMVFSDSADCDHPESRIPAPFGKRNYIIDVGGNTRGIAYDGIWTAEIVGFSQSFLTYVAALEGIGIGATDEDDSGLQGI